VSAVEYLGQGHAQGVEICAQQVSLHAMALRPCLALVCIALAAAPAVAEVYRYKDKSGQWVFSDRQPDAVRAVEPVQVKSGAAAPRISVEPRTTPQGISIVAVNECRCSVEFGLRVGNMRETETVRATVAPRSERLLFSLPPPAGKVQIPFDFGYVIGVPGAEHSPRGPYRAPFANARSFTVSQAPPDHFTHLDPSSRYAVDFAMPEGSAVHAAREGVVINVAHRFFRGGLAPSNQDEANFVQILHDDGTNAIYAHLQMDSIRVRPGQRVARGEYIANSGNTGFSSGPHLHFAVLRNAGMRSVSVPVTFAGPGRAIVAPRTGSTLTAY
jgi:murein DD-endopeptidase MepM/ murein hydrolase activator NlpD